MKILLLALGSLAVAACSPNAPEKASPVSETAPLSVKYERTVAGTLSDTREAGGPIVFFDLTFNNRRRAEVKLPGGGRTGSGGWYMSQPEASVEISDDGQTWQDPFWLNRHVVAAGSTTVGPGTSDIIMVPIPARLASGEIKARFLRVCVQGIEGKDICSEPFGSPR